MKKLLFLIYLLPFALFGQTPPSTNPFNPSNRAIAPAVSGAAVSFTAADSVNFNKLLTGPTTNKIATDRAKAFGLYYYTKGRVDGQKDIRDSLANLNYYLSFNSVYFNNNAGNFSLNTGVINELHGLGINGDAAVGTNVSTPIIVNKAGSIAKVVIKANTSPTGASLIADIKVNGTSIWSGNAANKITLISGATSSSSNTFTNAAVSAGDIITFDINQVGSTTPGNSITIQITINQ